MESMRYNMPTFDRNLNESAKYNQILGRDTPKTYDNKEWENFDRFERFPRYDRYERYPWENRFENRMMPWGYDRFDRFENRTMPWGYDRFDRFEDRTMPWGYDRFNRFENRMMPWGYDRFDRFENRMMPWGYDRFNRFENRMMPWGYDRFDRFENRMMPWGYDRFERFPWSNNWFNRFDNKMMPWNFEHFMTKDFDRTFDWFTNLCNVNFRPSHPMEYYTLMHPIRFLDRDGNRDLHLHFDLRGYKPEEITCTFDRKERCITVEATHDIKEGKEHHVMRKFCRKYYLPASLAKCDLTKSELKCCLEKEGLLCIELPLPKMTTEEISRCPTMTKAMFPWSRSEGCYDCHSCNTTPITCKNL